MHMASATLPVNTAPIAATGNGSTPVNGRGIKHRKLTRQGRVSLAADIVTGSRPYVPSLAQTCTVFDVPVTAVRAEIKARAAEANGNGRAKTLTPMAAELVNQLGLDGARPTGSSRQLITKSCGPPARMPACPSHRTA